MHTDIESIFLPSGTRRVQLWGYVCINGPGCWYLQRGHMIRRIPTFRAWLGFGRIGLFFSFFLSTIYTYTHHQVPYSVHLQYHTTLRRYCNPISLLSPAVGDEMPSQKPLAANPSRVSRRSCSFTPARRWILDPLANQSILLQTDDTRNAHSRGLWGWGSIPVPIQHLSTESITNDYPASPLPPFPENPENPKFESENLKIQRPTWPGNMETRRKPDVMMDGMREQWGHSSWDSAETGEIDSRIKIMGFGTGMGFWNWAGDLWPGFFRGLIFISSNFF